MRGRDYRRANGRLDGEHYRTQWSLLRLAYRGVSNHPASSNSELLESPCKRARSHPAPACTRPRSPSCAVRRHAGGHGRRHAGCHPVHPFTGTAPHHLPMPSCIPPHEPHAIVHDGASCVASPASMGGFSTIHPRGLCPHGCFQTSI